MKERIKSFGFRVVSDGAPSAQGKPADFKVVGEARLKKLSARLEASGITVEKYLLTSWTVKCIDRHTGEEIYFNNKLPVAQGSWATPEQSLAAIGGRIAEEFSRDFFLQHFNPGAHAVVLRIDGLPASAHDAVLRELLGLQSVLGASSRGAGTYDLQVSGAVRALPDLVSSTILVPLNAKLGQACFRLGATTEQQVGVHFDKACTDGAVVARFETNPPASLYAAPPARRSSVVKDPGAARKLQI